MQESNVQQKVNSKTRTSKLASVAVCSILGFIVLGFGIFLFAVASSSDSSTDALAIATTVACIGLSLFKPAIEFRMKLPEE